MQHYQKSINFMGTRICTLGKYVQLHVLAHVEYILYMYR
jgi:hypothetical protein